VEIENGTWHPVKWFNSQKGYGFIQPQNGGGKDVFVHISAVDAAGLSGLNEGQIVEYDEVPNKGKTSAENLKVQRWPLRNMAIALPENHPLPATPSGMMAGWILECSWSLSF
jgi:cold shock protein